MAYDNTQERPRGIRRRLFVQRTAALAAAGTLYPLAPNPGFAKDDPFPSRPVKIIVPFPPGGGSDGAARFVADQLPQYIQQPVIVENKPGASGLIAINAVKAAPADGYTILLGGNSPMAAVPAMSKVPYDPVNDFQALSGLTRGMVMLGVSANSRFKTFEDLLQALKSAEAKPLLCGTFSDGYRLSIEWLARLAGFRFENVSYKGQEAMTAELVGGHLDFAVIEAASAAELVKGGRIRPLVVSGEARHPLYPTVETLKEVGYPDYSFYSWTSLYVKAGTPRPAFSVLSGALEKIMNSAAALQYAKNRGTELMPYSAEKMQQFQKDQLRIYTETAIKARLRS